jgi:hypothetical protein
MMAAASCASTAGVESSKCEETEDSDDENEIDGDGVARNLGQCLTGFRSTNTKVKWTGVVQRFTDWCTTYCQPIASLETVSSYLFYYGLHNEKLKLARTDNGKKRAVKCLGRQLKTTRFQLDGLRGISRTCSSYDADKLSGMFGAQTWKKVCKKTSELAELHSLIRLHEDNVENTNKLTDVFESIRTNKV